MTCTDLSTEGFSRFDWYQGSLPDDSRMGALDVLAPLGDEPPVLIRGIHAYDRGWEIRREGSAFARLYEGRGLADHFIGSGADAPEIARTIRLHAPGHRVSRADVCLDFDAGPDFFSSTRDLVVQNLAGKVTLTHFVEQGISGDSATLYVGAKSSETRVRIYEKGKEDHAYAPETVRVEIQARPAKLERKLWAGEVDPSGYWGLARWSRWLAESVCEVSAPAAPVRSARVSDLDASLNAAGIQYGKRFRESLELHGGDLEAFALDLISRIPYPL